MPIYEYRCESCGHLHDALQKVSDPHLSDCPECAAPALKRLISAPSFRLKGSGWYETDFKSDKEKKRNLVDGKPDGGDSGKPDGKADGKSDAGVSGGSKGGSDKAGSASGKDSSGKGSAGGGSSGKGSSGKGGGSGKSSGGSGSEAA